MQRRNAGRVAQLAFGVGAKYRSDIGKLVEQVASENRGEDSTCELSCSWLPKLFLKQHCQLGLPRFVMRYQDG